MIITNCNKDTLIIPDQIELIELLKFWTKEKITLEFASYFCHEYAAACNEDINGASFRINHIATAIMDDRKVKEVMDEVYAEFGNSQDKVLWNMPIWLTQQSQ